MFQLKNFSLKYNNINIIKNVSGNFIVENDINIIFGENGSGKTSLLKVFNLQNEEYEGEVSYRGKNYKELTKFEKRSLRNVEFGFVPQKLNLIDDLTALENLEIIANKKFDKEHYENLLVKLNIGTSFHNKKVKSLSGGMKQRVAIARALVNNPRVIFFDEPTASLDFKNIDNFIDVLYELKDSGITSVVITHEEMFFEKFDNIIEVENTKVIPTYKKEEMVEEIEFLKVKKPNLKLLSRSQRLLKTLMGMLIFISIMLSDFLLYTKISFIANEVIFILLAVAIYVVVYVIILILLILVTRNNNQKLFLLGYAKKEIVKTNINLVRNYLLTFAFVILILGALFLKNVDYNYYILIALILLTISAILNRVINLLSMKRIGK